MRELRKNIMNTEQFENECQGDDIHMSKRNEEANFITRCIVELEAKFLDEVMWGSGVRICSHWGRFDCYQYGLIGSVRRN